MRKSKIWKLRRHKAKGKSKCRSPEASENIVPQKKKGRSMCPRVGVQKTMRPS